MSTLDDIVSGHETRLNLLTTIAERQQTLSERIDKKIDQMDERLEETRRDTAMTRRLWVNLAKKNGWLDDDDLA